VVGLCAWDSRTATTCDLFVSAVSSDGHSAQIVSFLDSVFEPKNKPFWLHGRIITIPGYPHENWFFLNPQGSRHLPLAGTA
jgi:hypothetical protein